MEEMPLLVTALLLSAAATPPTAPLKAPPTPRQITACAIATRQEVQHALQVPVEAGAGSQQAGGSTCDYAGESGQVTITLRRAAQPLDLQAELAALKAALPEARVSEIPLPGVRALLLDLHDSGAQLHILRNGRDYLLVSVLGFGGAAQARVAAESIAQRALARL